MITGMLPDVDGSSKTQLMQASPPGEIELETDMEPIEHSIQANESTSQVSPPISRPERKCRNLVGFWLLGLCNNFGYVIMLSAAHDILKDEPPHQNGTNASIIDPELLSENRSGKLIPECNKIGTGAILLADILPCLVIKLTAPWYIQSVPYGIRVITVTVLAAISFPVVAWPKVVWVNLLGVALASASSGLGEITFLSLTSYYHKSSVSSWSSGTGAAGIFGALLYAGLTAAGLTPRVTIIIMIIIPVVMAASYFFILIQETSFFTLNQASEEESPLVLENKSTTNEINSLPLIDKLKLALPLLKYMVPLFAVYFAEYFINQALFELIYFKNIWLPIIQQYRWYQVIYQLGVFISRSSVSVFQIRHFWFLSVLQVVNIGLLLLEIFFRFIPSIWIIFVIILYEGLLGGGTYVNAFYRISSEVSPTDYREFSMGVASISDASGIALAGAVAVPFHNFMCTL